jgi:hypothetical protein
MTIYRHNGREVTKHQYHLLKQEENEQFKRDVEQLLAEKKLVAPQVKPNVTVKQFHNLINDIADY